jgi:predicted nucleic acid-binding protein
VASGAAEKHLDWRAARLVALDTSPLVYYVEDHPEFAPALFPLFQSIERGRRRAVVSSLALLEILVAPYRAGDDARRAYLTALLSSFPNLTWVNLDPAIADRAASLRARYSLSTPDAIHLASALASQADVFLTNDRALRRVQEVSVLLVEELPRP